MKCIHLLLVLLLVPCAVRANGVTEHQARLAVETWVRSVTADARPNAVIQRMEPHQSEGQTVAYIAHLAGGGYCLCGADEAVLPVYLYSPNGSYDPQNPACQAILQEISTRTRMLLDAVVSGAPSAGLLQKVLPERSRFWRELITGSVSIKRERTSALYAAPDSMSVPLTSQWGQSSPYNDECPELEPGSDERALVGCTAISIAQLLYYWQWPAIGVGSHTDRNDYEIRWRTDWDEEPLADDPQISLWWAHQLEWTSTNGGRLRMSGYWDGSVYKSAQDISSAAAYRTALDALYNRMNTSTTSSTANFGATTYQWNLMRDSHSDPVDAGDAAVATFCYQVAVGLDSYFGVDGTSSSLWRAIEDKNNRNMLVDNFRYDEDATHGEGNIADLVTEEIQWLRPVGFRGATTEDHGHAWVLFGYNKGTAPVQFRMNMGWYGDSDSWYSLDSVPGEYTLNQAYLIQVAPKSVVRFVGAASSGDGSPSQPHQNIAEAVSAASDGTTLIFKAGSINTFSAPLSITKRLTLKGRNATIRNQ